jgi:hypothetical protein
MAKPDKKTDKKPTPTPPASNSSNTPEKESLVDSRFALPLDKDGRVLLDTMRPASLDKLREILTDPTVAAKLGTSSAESPGIPGRIELPPMLLFPLVNTLSLLDTLIIARVTKAPREIVERFAPYSREEAQQIAPALGAVLGKYGTGFLTKYGEEVALVSLLSMMTMSKIAAVREEMERTTGPRGVVAPFVAPDRHEPEPPAPGPGEGGA